MGGAAGNKVWGAAGSGGIDVLGQGMQSDCMLHQAWQGAAHDACSQQVSLLIFPLPHSLSVDLPSPPPAACRPAASCSSWRRAPFACPPQPRRAPATHVRSGLGCAQTQGGQRTALTRAPLTCRAPAVQRLVRLNLKACSALPVHSPATDTSLPPHTHMQWRPPRLPLPPPQPRRPRPAKPLHGVRPPCCPAPATQRLLCSPLLCLLLSYMSCRYVRFSDEPPLSAAHSREWRPRGAGPGGDHLLWQRTGEGRLPGCLQVARLRERAVGVAPRLLLEAVGSRPANLQRCLSLPFSPPRQPVPAQVAP